MTQMMTVPSALEEAAVTWADALWQKFETSELTFGEMSDRVGVIARALVGVGVGPGTRVGMFLANCEEWLLTELAVTSVGAWFVPLNTMLRPNELRTLLVHSQCEVLVWGSHVFGRDTVDTLRELVRGEERTASRHSGDEISPELPALRTVVGFGAGSWPEWVMPWDDMLKGAEGTSQRTVEALARAVRPDDVALVIYTSGTTGQPKGVLQTHGSVNAAISRFAARLGLGPGDRSIFASPLFWIHGCWHQALVPLHCGSGLVLDTRFDPLRFLQTVVADRCTHLQGVPTQYEMILSHPESAAYDLTGLRVVQIGGSTFHPSLLDRLRERAPNASFLAAYGLTEAGVVTYTTPDDSFEDIARTVGRMHPGGEAVVVDEENDEPVEAGQPGELCLRSDCVMKGYLDDAEASSRALRGGWLHTGDLAVMEDRGRIRILGRNQDAYKRGGVTVYAADVETVLCEHPDVAAAAVVGVADRVLGQVGVAFIAPAVGTDPDLEKILSGLKDRLATYQLPKEIRILDEFPRTGSGKIRKFELRAFYEATARADVTPGSTKEPRP